MNRLVSVIVTLLTVVFVQAQAPLSTPVHFTTALKKDKSADAELIFTAQIDKGWHVYGNHIASGGPTVASLHINKMDGVTAVGKLVAKGKEISTYDKMFDMQIRYFEHQVTFVQKIRFTKPTYSIDCYLEYGACNDKECLPPSEVDCKYKGKSTVFATDAAAETNTSADSIKTKDMEKQSEKVAADTTTLSATGILKQLWKPVITELQTFNGTTDTASLSLWTIFFEGLLGGFLAIFTPCVWPIIPMTVSFFLKRNKDRSKAIREALAYGLSIVAIYVSLGLVVTLAFGANALNAMATNAVFNIFFFLLLVVFGISFLGAFELTLPSSWINKVDSKSDKATGILSIFLMAFTLSLVSFSCTGPIIGFLLVAVGTQGSVIAPTVGMLGFSIALAIPFTLFALFPSLLKSAPKSGSWMNVLKATLGFIELAFALKFLSVADMAYGWHILDREFFIFLWIVIFSLLGLYLLGWLKLPSGRQRTNVIQVILALASLSFAVYMIPGLWGAPVTGISAFAPTMSTLRFSKPKVLVEAKYKDYDKGMLAARTEKKPVLIDFTGFGCVNCRKMEAAVWTDPQVEQLINSKYILISLYVDDKTALPKPIRVVENGQQRMLRTVGDKWSYLQRVKFGANAQPFYVLLDNEGRPLNGSRSYNEDVKGYVDFLKKGLENYTQT